ncbi:MAG: hypothetical protein ACM3YO_01300 [Bacteroidota bacterium]
MSVDRAEIVSYLVRQLDRNDLSEEEFNHLLQEVGLEPPSESARIGTQASALVLPPERKGEGVE